MEELENNLQKITRRFDLVITGTYPVDLWEKGEDGYFLHAEDGDSFAQCIKKHC